MTLHFHDTVSTAAEARALAQAARDRLRGRPAALRYGFARPVPAPAPAPKPAPAPTPPPPVAVLEPPAEMPRLPPTTMTVAATIIDQAAAHFGVTVADVLGRGRWGRYTAARHVAVHAIRSATGWSYPRIGQRFGGLDHTTCLHATRRVEADSDLLAASYQVVAAVQEKLGIVELEDDQ